MHPTPMRQPTLKFLSSAGRLPLEAELGEHPGLHAYGETDRGKVRESNEDQFLVAQTDRVVRIEGSSFPLGRDTAWPVAREAKILMVADGIGGHAHGEVASAVAVDAMLDAVTSMQARATQEPQAAFEDGVRRAQEQILAVALRKGLQLRPGTTLTMAYVDWPTMYVVHAGDSRCYLFRHGEMRQLTEDHTMAAGLVAAGLSPEHANVTRSKNILVNAVGGGTEDLQVDFSQHQLQRGDRVLLCTDGVHDTLRDGQIQAIVDGAADFRQATSDLVSASLTAGGTDNVTAVILQVSG